MNPHKSPIGTYNKASYVLKDTRSPILFYTPKNFCFYTGKTNDLPARYSVFILSTGFSLAVFQFWRFTVKNVITETITKAAA